MQQAVRKDRLAPSMCTKPNTGAKASETSGVLSTGRSGRPPRPLVCTESTLKRTN